MTTSVDVVCDVVTGAWSTITDAIDIVKSRGTVVIAGVKGDNAVPGLQSDKIVLKSLTIKGVRGKRSASYTLAINLLESKRFPLERLGARTYPLKDALLAIGDLAASRPPPAGLGVSRGPA